MKTSVKGLSYLLGLFLGGCCCEIQQKDLVPRCGSPCPHITPQSISRASLLEAYRASALGRDLPLDAQVAASRALQDLLRTGDYRHDSRWQLPPPPKCRLFSNGELLPKGRFLLVSVRHHPKTSCITYRQDIVFPHKVLRGHGTACRAPSGLWRIVEEHPYGIR